MRYEIIAIAVWGAIGLSSMADARSFRHPGAFDSAAEFEVRAEGVRRQVQPWTADFAKLRSNSHDRPNYLPHPVTVVVRGLGRQPENYGQLFNDAAAAYALALDWRITGDAQRGVAAARILTAWAKTLERIDGTADRYLASGLYGYPTGVLLS